MAQEIALNVDMVGMLRRKVQIVMRDFSFSEYQKDHVTYIIDSNVSQRINYSADTCSSMEFFIKSNYSDAFTKKLISAVDSVGIKVYQEQSDSKIRFLITTGTNRNKLSHSERIHVRSKRFKEKPEKNVTLSTKESKASDERYFKLQKPTDFDNSSHVKVLGWKNN